MTSLLEISSNPFMGDTRKWRSFDLCAIMFRAEGLRYRHMDSDSRLDKDCSHPPKYGALNFKTALSTFAMIAPLLLSSYAMWTMWQCFLEEEILSSIVMRVRAVV